MILKIQVPNVRTLFTEFKILHPSRFYGVTKLVWFRKYIGNPILKKNVIILILKKRIKEYLELSGTLGKLKIGQDGHKLGISRPHAAIFDIFTFRPKPAVRNLKNAKNVFFFHEKCQKTAKNENFKNRRMGSRETQFMSILANFHLPEPSGQL